MMNIEIAPFAPMAETGSSLLRILQNQSMPLLDLFVRESIQNALDASLKGQKKVFVDMFTDSFEPNELNSRLESIGPKFDKLYATSKISNSFIAIKDSNTTGLTGPKSIDDVRDNRLGNYLKLVREISKPQSEEGAGGSWGLGKTIYFRVGIGLVIYYSRFYQNNKYQNRLAACFVEDENAKNRLLDENQNIRRGIAWFGELDKNGNTQPITNEDEIEELLSIFGIEPYSGEDTGTCIIIPYIDEENLLMGTIDGDNDRPYWTNSIENYLKVAIQRWYAPRLANSKYEYGAFLNASVNGKMIKASDMLPLFAIIRDLYIYSYDVNSDLSYIDDPSSIYVNDITIKGELVKSNSSGKFVSIKASLEDLEMTAPDNCPSPYCQIKNVEYEYDRNVPIVTYTRKPGMLVGYDFEGPWTHNAYSTDVGEYIIGIFVPNSIANLAQKANDGGTISLEEYLRRCEKADHSFWEDITIGNVKQRIVSKTQTNVKTKITKNYKIPEKTSETFTATGLSSALARILLPNTGFGGVATRSIGKRGPTSTIPKVPKSKKPLLTVTSPVSFENDLVVIPFDLFIPKQDDEVNVLLKIDTEFSKIVADKWEDEMNSEFPLSIEEFVVNRITQQGKSVMTEVIVGKGESKVLPSYFSVKAIESKKYKQCGQINIISMQDSIVLGCVVKFKSKDYTVKSVINVEEVKNEPIV